MPYCIICENEFPKEKLKQVISKNGITLVCQGCFREDMPLFKKPEEYQFEGIYKRKSVYERLSQAAGLKSPEDHKKRISEFGKDSGRIKDESLRMIVNKNFEAKAKKYPKNEDLVDNFHWILMRARRFKKISQKQLAERIKEPESAITLAEKGFIAQGSDFFIKKLEQFLGVRISKMNLSKERATLDENKEKLIQRLEREGELSEEMTENLTIEDLKNIKNRKKKRWWQFGKKSGDEEELVESGLELDYEEINSDFDKSQTF